VAQELDISATPAREGLLALQGEGFPTVEPHRGFLVSPLSAEDIGTPFEGQALLAGELAARAALVATPVEVRALGDPQNGLDAAAEGGDYDRVEQLNFEFHRTLYRLARAPKISWLLGAPLRYAP
jgi:DNA-binding GntR family transcriptional regulator